MIPYPTDHDDPGAAAAPGRARAAVDPVLRACLHTLPDAVRAVCAYQLGWGDRAGAPTGGGAGAGTAIGPALVLAAARAAGGRDEAALPAAAAVELVRQSTLLHAGVTGPAARRRPPTRAVFGTTGAGAAGEAMAALAVRLVVGRPEAVTVLCDRLIELCGARAARRAAGPAVPLPGPGALFGLACALGAIHGGAPPWVTAALDA
ncbi:polyprenyl synthetase family protein, partial [Streptomyces sp. M-16]